MGTLDKDELRRDFSSKYKDYYQTGLFSNEGFIRKQCRECKKNFWTLDNSRELCGDPEHEPYTFIKDVPKDISYVEFWNKFADFFKKNNHAIIDRYPVVSRWRQDLYFTIASIQDFQRIENGLMSFEYGANPLIVPQMCMRFNDVPNVGITGRHLTSFMMTGQHAFNYPKEGYWRDKTIDLNYKFMTQVLGVKRESLTYIEDVWAMGDFSEFGPCLESFSGGSELSNSVFTQYEYVNNKIKELDGMVVDVGWGFERLLWFYTGADTIYDASFSKQLKYIAKSSGITFDRKIYRKVADISGFVNVGDAQTLEKFDDYIIKRAKITKDDYYNVIKPMQAAYAIADHSRSLLFGVTDGALPSNVGGGYNLRIILRRMFDLVDEYNINLDIIKLMELHASELKGLYDELSDGVTEMSNIMEVERKRYDATKSAAGKIVDTMLAKKESITTDKLKLLYESNGITPEHIAIVAKSKGINVEIPENFYSSIIKSNFAEGKKTKVSKSYIDTSTLPKTEKLFYSFTSKAQARAIKIEGNEVVLDKTPFYAESGGQEADFGMINGINVVDVQSSNGVIVHTLEDKPNFLVNNIVNCEVDIDRRLRLMVHHTATHLISASCRKILGKHAWQEGAHKGPNKAHIDIAHHERLSDSDISKIEAMANKFIFNGIKVKVSEMERGVAESKFGFSIYQGHGVPGSLLRIVELMDLNGTLIDAEACGGLHLMNRESSIGIIKIINTSKIHDGINRIEFVAGPAALDYTNDISSKISKLSNIMNSDVDKLEESASQQKSKINKLESDIKIMTNNLSISIAEEIISEMDNLNAYQKKLDYPREILRSVCTHVVDKNKKSIIMLYNKDDEIVCISGIESQQSAIDFAKSKLLEMKMDFVGGGSGRIAEGKAKSR